MQMSHIKIPLLGSVIGYDPNVHAAYFRHIEHNNKKQLYEQHY